MNLTISKVSTMFFDQIITIMDHNVTWKKIQYCLYNLYGEETYNSWLSSLKFVSSRNGEVLLSVSTRFIKEWITVHYMEKILSLWQSEDQSVCAIDIQVIEERNSNSNTILKK
jgi:chromosomal replication initiator protein